MSYDLTGKSIVVTGATSGIGLAAVDSLVKSGAFVIGIGRSNSRIQSARDSILKEVPEGKITFILADLASQAQVKKAASEIFILLNQNHYKHLDVLVNNAGVYLEKIEITEDGIEKTFAVNHLAPFFLTHELLPLLKQSSDGRVLSLSSYAHFTTPLNLNRIANPWPYISLLAYKRSKLCNVLFTYALNRRLENVTAVAIDPGLVNTAIASKGGKGISHWVWRKRRKKGIPAKESAQTILYLSGEKSLNTSVSYYFNNYQPKKPSHKATRVDLASALWELSCQLTGINW